MRTLSCLPLLLVGAHCLSLPAKADLILYEPFDYPVGTALEGADGGAGFDGPWIGA
jgi:hypothetical protein